MSVSSAPETSLALEIPVLPVDAATVVSSDTPAPSRLTALARIRFLSHSLSGASWVLGPLLIYKTTSSLPLAALLLALEWLLRAAFSFGVSSFLDRFRPSKTFAVLECSRAVLLLASAALFIAPPFAHLAYLAFGVQLAAQVAYASLQALTEVSVTAAAKLDKKPLFQGQTQVRSSELIAACAGSAFLAVLGLVHVPASVTSLLLALLALNCGYWSKKSLAFLDVAWTQKRRHALAKNTSSKELDTHASALPLVTTKAALAVGPLLWTLSLVNLSLNVPVAVFWGSLSFWFSSPGIPLATVLMWVSTYKLVENLLAATWMYAGSRFLSQKRLMNLSALGWLLACAAGVWVARTYGSELPLAVKFLFPMLLSSSVVFLNQSIRTYRQALLRGPRRLRITQRMQAFEMLSYPLAALVLYVWGYSNPWVYGLGVLGVAGLLVFRRHTKQLLR